MNDQTQGGGLHVKRHRRAALNSAPRYRERSGKAIIWRWCCRKDMAAKACLVVVSVFCICMNLYLLRGESLKRELSRGNYHTPVHAEEIVVKAAKNLAGAQNGLPVRELYVKQEVPEAVPAAWTPAVLKRDPDQPESPLTLCGLQERCGRDSVALHVSVGREAKGQERAICFNGNQVVFGDDADAGVMVMSADPSTLAVQTRVFATGTSIAASGELLTFLDGLANGSIVVMAADGARAAPFLSDTARQAIFNTGSGMVHILDENHAWALATVKGLAFTTPYESIAPPLTPPGDAGREDVAQLAVCMARNIYLSATNIHQRKAFCANHGGTERHGDFCSDLAVSQYLLPVPMPAVAKRSAVLAAEAARIAALPVTIVARHDRADYLQQCLSSLFTNPGLSLPMVTVYIDSFSQEIRELTNLFAVRTRFFPKTVSTSTMKIVHRKADTITSHYARVVPLAWSTHPAAKYMVILEEDHTLSPGFLSYFAQLIPVVDKDTSLMAVSAYNDNGYKHAAQDGSLVYRSEFFPGRAWMLPRRSWDGWQASFPTCCGGWSWDLWIRDPAQRRGREVLIPDVPRAHHIGKRGTQVADYYWQVYFQPAVLHRNVRERLRDVDSLTKDAYEAKLNSLIRSALPLPTAKKTCGVDMVPETFGMVYVLFYRQNNPEDLSQLQALTKCFHLWDLGVRGAHNGVLRFHSKYNHIILVGAKTIYGQKLMPADITPYSA